MNSTWEHLNWAERDMIQGYLDGTDPDSPEPSSNRSRSYRHGFECGRDDILSRHRADAYVLREEAERAIKADMAA